MIPTAVFAGILLNQAASQAPQETELDKPVTVGDVSSNASNGVTAGYVGTLNQTVLPTVVRGPLLARFQEQFVIGARLFRQLQDSSLTDDQYNNLFDQINRWYSSTFDWLQKDVGPWAAERFALKQGSAMGWMLSGNHAPGIAETRSAMLNSLMPLLQNLDQLMREPTIYPAKP